MRFKQVGNKADLIAVVIRNNDANSKVLLNGAPCFFIADATLRGLDVNTAEGLANANQAFFAGFNLNPSRNIGDFGEAMAFGYYDYARVLLATRATSTDVWASYAAVVLGDIMSFVTTSGVQAIARSAAASATNVGWWIQAAATLVSQTTQASSIANGIGNSTAMVTQLRVQVRAI